MKIFPFILLLFFSKNIFLQKNSIKVWVKNCKINKGKIFVALYDEKDKMLKGISQVTDNEQVSTIFEDIPEGKYAVKVYQDLNNNGELDKNFIGIPKEPYGLSNNIRPKFAPPAFKDMLFDVKGEKIIEILLE
jgi:uncharacterized protein (DUF2141 family)